MDKITQVNIEGHNYGFVAGQAVRGVSGAQAADYVKTVILPEGASLVEGMLLAVTFVNGNTAGFSGSISVYSSDGETFYYDAQMTDPVVLPPDHCYSIEHVSGDEYVYLAYVCLSINNVLTPVSNASGYLSGGPLWESGDTVLFVYFSDFFMMTKQNSGPSDYSRQGAYCDTDGSIANKTAKMIGFAEQTGQTFPITFAKDNTYDGALTLSINNTTAYPLYINGSVSSSSNKTLPAGTYLIRFAGEVYYLETTWGAPYARYAEHSDTVVGVYTGSGGQQNPQYVGKNRVRFNMMNTTINGNSQYKDFALMDCYSGHDVGGAVGIGVCRQSMRVFAMRSDAGTSPNRPTSWANTCEINTSTYTQVPTSQPSVALNNGAIWVI